MFFNFVDELREAGIGASFKEHLTLIEALDKDVIEQTPEAFYYLSRATFVKDEGMLDRFDQVFHKVFKGILTDYGQNPVDVPEDWLKAVAEKFLTEEEMAEIEKLGSWEEIMETLKERLAPWVPPASDDRELTALDAVIAACLDPEPGRRPAAAQVVDELERLSWSIDERNRALAFAPGGPDAGSAGPASDETTDPRRVPHAPSGVADRLPAHDTAHVAPDDDPTVVPVRRPVGTQPAHDTVYRTDRRPAHPDRPSRRRRRVGIAIALLAVVAIVAVMVSRRSDGSAASVELVERPGGLGEITDLDWPFGDIGECLLQVGERLDAVACDRPHDLQRTAVDTLPPESFPTDAEFDRDAVRAVVRTACLAAFESFVGEPVDASVLESPFSAPSAETWSADGDRTFQCFAGAADRRVVGDARRRDG